MKNNLLNKILYSFNFFQNPFCQQFKPLTHDVINSLGCMCRGNFACKCTKGFNLSISQFDNFQKIEVFNITGRRIFLSDVRNKELFKGAIKDLPE